MNALDHFKRFAPYLAGELHVYEGSTEELWHHQRSRWLLFARWWCQCPNAWAIQWCVAPVIECVLALKSRFLATACVKRLILRFVVWKHKLFWSLCALVKAVLETMICALVPLFGRCFFASIYFALKEHYSVFQSNLWKIHTTTIITKTNKNEDANKIS